MNRVSGGLSFKSRVGGAVTPGLFFFFNFKFSVRAPCGLLAPYQGLNSHPLQRKRRVLTTGLPGTSHCSRF